MIKLFGLDWKSQFKIKKYLVFYLIMLKNAKTHVKMAQNWPKMSQNAHYLTLFNTIQHYLTLFDF